MESLENNVRRLRSKRRRINRRAGKENIQHKLVIVPSDLAKIRASPFLSLVLHSCKVRTEWSTATASFPSGCNIQGNVLVFFGLQSRSDDKR